MDFKVGDKVRIVNPDRLSRARGYKVGDTFTVEKARAFYIINQRDHAFWLSEVELVGAANNKNTMAKKIGAMMKKLLDDDTKTLVKAGYINGDLELTAEGTAALDAIIFELNKAALVEAAKAEIAETVQ